MAETLRLYHAWLGYLLTRLGADEVRVPTEDIRRALTRLSCRVEKDGTDYVIHLEKGATGGEHHDG